MICKERDAREHGETDKYSAAGAKAEEQMAFYLKRAFQDTDEVWVFNDLRFEGDDGDACQIDHLLMHRSGFIVIESKSVTSKVRVHGNGEWERLWNGHWQGMSSPVKQAERQIQFLRKEFQARREQLLGKMLLGTLQLGFTNMPFEVLVAISDTGSIDRKGDCPEVTKADLVPDRVREIVARHKKARSPLTLKIDFKSNDGLYKFKDNEVEAIRRWLMEHHRPKAKESVLPEQPAVVTEAPVTYKAPPPPPSMPTPAPRASPVRPSAVPFESGTVSLGKCEKCGAQSEILWGKFGYYWKCPQCQSNMPLKEFCPSCREKLHLRKDKNRFYKHCETCQTPEALYFEAKS